MEIHHKGDRVTMVYVYLTDIRHLPDPENTPQVCDGLPEDRIRKTLRYRNSDDRRRSLAAGLLLRHVLHVHGAEDACIQYTANEKPECDSLCFNLSHSGDLVACAVSSRAVGCDVERIKKAAMHVAERYFCPSEITLLQQCTGERQDDTFFRLWTAKESYMKMTGEGMSLSLNRFAVDYSDRIRIFRDGTQQTCSLHEYPLQGYKLTVCAEEHEFADTVTQVNFHDRLQNARPTP